jgi:short-subunit dehydrogenase
MGGKIYTPMGGWYHATKFALESLSDCLRLELEPFGVDVVVVEPGSIATEWAGIAADKLRTVSGSGAYAEQADAVASELGRTSANPRPSSPPSVIADTIVKAVTATRPKTRYAAGNGARLAIGLRRVLSDRAFDRIIRRILGVPSPRSSRRRTPPASVAARA